MAISGLARRNLYHSLRNTTVGDEIADVLDIAETLSSAEAAVIDELALGRLELPVETLTANNDSGSGSSITAGTVNVNVSAVNAGVNDWIVLPAIADVPIGHTINICCNASSNFEMRTPASSGTTINNVDSDGTQEYLCTDTDLIRVTKLLATGWVAQSITALGAVRTAVVPD